jgi:hypothetical protein
METRCTPDIASRAPEFGSRVVNDDVQEKKNKISKTKSFSSSVVKLLTQTSDAVVDDGDDPGTPFLLEIHTRLGGFNSGKIYVFRHSDRTILEAWAEEMGRLSVKCQKLETSMAMSSWQRWQRKIAWYYREEREKAADADSERGRGRQGEEENVTAVSRTQRAWLLTNDANNILCETNPRFITSRSMSLLAADALVFRNRV